MAEVNLTKAVRSNLLSLQSTAAQMAKTQERLATGLKVNSALDNPSSFFTASALSSRAGDMANLLDSMASGIQTLEAADNGLTAITKNLESMQSTLRQARQDKTFQTKSFALPEGTPAAAGQLSFTGGAVGTVAMNMSITKDTAGTAAISFGDGGTLDTGDTLAFTVTIDGDANAVSITGAEVAATGNGDSTLNAAEFRELLAGKVTGATIGGKGNNVTITSDSTGTTSTVAVTLATLTDADTSSSVTAASIGLGGAVAGTAGADDGAFKTVDDLVTDINRDFDGMLRASNDNGKLRIENLSTQELDIAGASDSGVTGVAANTASIDGNSVRAELATQYNELRDQLDKLSDDASFNGVNLLRGDNLKITFNETGTSALDIQTKGGESINAATLGLVTNMNAADLDSDAGIDTYLAEVKTAIDSVRSQASTFGSSLSIVQNREDFTKSMINTLETGAGNLTLADTNEEAANLLALQTRQQLSSTALSMASQADQAVLRLF